MDHFRENTSNMLLKKPTSKVSEIFNHHMARYESKFNAPNMEKSPTITPQRPKQVNLKNKTRLFRLRPPQEYPPNSTHPQHQKHPKHKNPTTPRKPETKKKKKKSKESRLVNRCLN
ncbi:hypothetical protein Dimus_031193 [Dionaea muscipula]